METKDGNIAEIKVDKSLKSFPKRISLIRKE